MDTFGSRLRSLREALGWSQEKLGFELETTGATISKWETGRIEPNLGHLERLLRLFSKDGVTLDWLIAGKKPGSAPIKPTRPTAIPLRAADNADEQALLARYRRLSGKRQKALLGFLEE